MSNPTILQNGGDSHFADVIIVGGGPAGLSTAVGLSRKMFKTTVFDDGSYRNNSTTYMHNFTGFDHCTPQEFRSRVRSQIQERYPLTEFCHRKVVDITKTSTEGEDSFQVVDEAGQHYTAKKIVLATGVRDILPLSIDGYQENWGQLIFHCLFCHGYEERDAPHAGVLAAESSMLINKDVAIAVAKTTKRFAKHVTIYTHGNKELAEELRSLLGEVSTISVDSRRLKRVSRVTGCPASQDHQQQDTLEVQFSETDALPASIAFLVHAPDTEMPNAWDKMLGLEVTEQGTYKTVSDDNETSVPGVYIAGDHSTMARAVATAVSAGAFVAGGVAHKLITAQ